MVRKDTKHNFLKNRYSLWNLFIYFFLLGTFGFGGAFTLANIVRTDLVEKKNWITQDQFKQSLAFTQIAPGPLLTEIAMYIGFIKSGIFGAAAAGIGFFITPGVAVLLLTIAYVHYGNLAWVHKAFGSITPAVIGMIISSTTTLTLTTVRKKFLWILLLGSFFTLLYTGAANYYLYIAGGLLSLIFYSYRKFNLSAFLMVPAQPFYTLTMLPLSKLFLFFFTAGILSFGGGLALLPVIQNSVVLHNHWLTNKQFLDGVAIAMVTPGPVVLISVFVGYLTAGFTGVLIATLGVFLPAYLVTIFLAPLLKRFGPSPHVKLFIDGVVAVAMGSIAWSLLILGKNAIYSPVTLGIAVCSFLGFRYGKIPSTLLVLLAGILGVFILR